MPGSDTPCPRPLADHSTHVTQGVCQIARRYEKSTWQNIRYIRQLNPLSTVRGGEGKGEGERAVPEPPHPGPQCC